MVRSKDIAWEHCTEVDGSTNKTQCNYCHKIMHGGGITRLKHHLAGGYDVEKCANCGEDVSNLFKTLLEGYQQSNFTKRGTPRKRRSQAIVATSQEEFEYTMEFEDARALSISDELDKDHRHKSNEIGWKHCTKIDGNTNKTQCNYCHKIMNGGGITRLKHHLAGGYDVESCSKCGEDVSNLFKAMLDGHQQSKYNKSGTLRKRYRRADLTPIQVSYDLESDVELHLARTQSVYEPKGTFRSSSLKKMSYIPTVCQNQPKLVWIWTTNKQVMTAAVERGWNTFIFTSQNRDLANEWSSIASIYPLFIEGEGLFDSENRKLAMFHKISSAKELNKLQAVDEEIKNVVLDLHWQVIPSETVVAALQDTQKAVFAISKTPSEAKILIEVFEQGLGGVVLKVEDVDAVHELKDCIDRRCEMGNPLNLVKATVTRVQVVGMGDCVCVDLCTLMRPGEGILVGSNDKGLFLVPPECEESNYVVRRAFRVNAGPVHTYVAVPGGKTSYLSELHEGKEVLVVHESGRQRTGMVGRVMIEKTHFILVEAKNSSDNQTLYSILLQNAATVGLVCPFQGNKPRKMVHPVTSLVVGDEVMLKVQGGTQTQNTGVEIPKFTPTQRIQEDATPQRILENASPEMIQEDESFIPPEIIQEDASHISLEMIQEDASHIPLEIIQEDGSLVPPQTIQEDGSFVPPQIIQEDGSLMPPQIIQEDVSLPRSDEV